MPLISSHWSHFGSRSEGRSAPLVPHALMDTIMYLPQHPRFFRLYDIQEHQQGVEHVVPALNPWKEGRIKEWSH